MRVSFLSACAYQTAVIATNLPLELKHLKNGTLKLDDSSNINGFDPSKPLFRPLKPKYSFENLNASDIECNNDIESIFKIAIDSKEWPFHSKLGDKKKISSEELQDLKNELENSLTLNMLLLNLEKFVMCCADLHDFKFYLSLLRNAYNNFKKTSKVFYDYLHVTELTIDGTELTEFPGWIVKLTKLEKLIFTNNKLMINENTFKVLEGLTNLKHLDLSNNPIKNLNLSLLNLSHLSSLSLKSTGMSKISVETKSCMLLKELNLADNRFEEFPMEISRLLYLKSLDLSSNLINSIPNGTVKLRYLRYLNLADNRLLEFELNFFGLNNLEKLDLSSNYLSRLPENFNDFYNLKVLNLSDNNFNKLPSQLFGLKSLMKLNLSWNIITSLIYKEYKLIESPVIEIDISNNNIAPKSKFSLKDHILIHTANNGTHFNTTQNYEDNKSSKFSDQPHNSSVFKNIEDFGLFRKYIRKELFWNISNLSKLVVKNNPKSLSAGIENEDILIMWDRVLKYFVHGSSVEIENALGIAPLKGSDKVTRKIESLRQTIEEIKAAANEDKHVDPNYKSIQASIQLRLKYIVMGYDFDNYLMNKIKCIFFDLLEKISSQTQNVDQLKRSINKIANAIDSLDLKYINRYYRNHIMFAGGLGRESIESFIKECIGVIFQDSLYDEISKNHSSFYSSSISCKNGLTDTSEKGEFFCNVLKTFSFKYLVESAIKQFLAVILDNNWLVELWEKSETNLLKIPLNEKNLLKLFWSMDLIALNDKKKNEYNELQTVKKVDDVCTESSSAVSLN